MKIMKLATQKGHVDNIVISDFQQKYVVLKAMRRSGGISKYSLMKN